MMVWFGKVLRVRGLAFGVALVFGLALSWPVLAQTAGDDARAVALKAARLWPARAGDLRERRQVYPVIRNCEFMRQVNQDKTEVKT